MNVGDRVKIVSVDRQGDKRMVGCIGTVAMYNEALDWVEVVVRNFGVSNQAVARRCRLHEVELVSSDA